MKLVFGLFTMLSAAALAYAADRRTLPDWTSLPPQLTGHTLTFITADGIRLNGKLLANGPSAFSVDISFSADVTRFPKGKQDIPHQAISEIHRSIRNFSFRQFAHTAFVWPLDMAIHANGFFTGLGEMDGGSATVLARIMDGVFSPFLLGWAAGGLAITPVATPIGYLRGSEHYDFRVR
jgi:hypothetical protein